MADSPIQVKEEVSKLEEQDDLLNSQKQLAHKGKMNLLLATGSPQLRNWETYAGSWTINYKEFHNTEHIKLDIKEEPGDGENRPVDEGEYNVDRESSLSDLNGIKESCREESIDAEEMRKSGEEITVVIKTEDEEEDVACDQCGEKRRTVNELKEHIYINHLSVFVDEDDISGCNKKRYKCTICKKAFDRRSFMVRHLMGHTGTKLVKCNLCSYRTSSQSKLKTHIRKHTGEKPFKCKLCDYVTSSQANLTVHNLTHSSEKPFKCNLCEYRSSRQSDIRIHNRTHSGEKPFKCNLCDYRTSRQSHIRTHNLRHTGEKPFKCNLCEYSTVSRSHLSRHIRTHTGEKPFKCNICDYSSIQRSHFTTHLQTHIGKMPFKCNICGYGTDDMSCLTKHILAHSCEKPFRCEDTE